MDRKENDLEEADEHEITKMAEKLETVRLCLDNSR